MLVEHGYDTVFGRRLFSLAVDRPHDVSSIVLPSPNFACFIAWDARDASVESVSALVEALLRAGASYFVCWGSDCERVHDIVDEISSLPGGEFEAPDGSCVMTTWHASDSLEESLFFFLVNTVPDERFQATTRASLGVSVGSALWARVIAEALDDPQRFVARV